MAGFTSNFSKDWESYFLNLKKVGTNNFYQILGPFIIGIRLSEIKSLNCYRPSLVIIGLWETIKHNVISFSNQGFMFEDFGYSVETRQLGVKYDRHKIDWESVAKIVDREKRISFGKDVTFKEFIECFDFWTGLEDPNKERHSYQAKILTYKLKLAAYLGEQNLQNDILNQILEEKVNWDLQVFELGFGPFEMWYNSLKEINTPNIRLKVESNKQHEKFKNLPNFKILL